MHLSKTEENYLKAIYKIAERKNKSASTNTIAMYMGTAPASVTDMLKRLAGKQMINYERYKGVTLTTIGGREATQLIRRHRLWEVFLASRLRFSWEAVHDIAEELEHIKSEELVNRLDAYLDYPKFDPHGDPIPNRASEFRDSKAFLQAQKRILFYIGDPRPLKFITIASFAVSCLPILVIFPSVIKISCCVPLKVLLASMT